LKVLFSYQVQLKRRGIVDPESNAPDLLSVMGDFGVRGLLRHRSVAPVAIGARDSTGDVEWHRDCAEAASAWTVTQ
jgi:hypothetical protein